jgi:hypothetical protein
VISTTKSG